MKYKREGGGKYVCSTNDNRRGECERVTVKIEFLRNLIERRFDKEMDVNELREVIEFIEVENDLIFTIGIKNDRDIVCAGNFIQF